MIKKKEEKSSFFSLRFGTIKAKRKGIFLMSKTKKIVLAAILLCLLIILSRFLSIKTPIVKISFAFIPTILCAVLLGPKWTIALNALGDVIGALLFPTGPYFFGYTVSTIVAAIIYSFLLYKGENEFYNRKQFLIRYLIACVLVMVIVNIGLNSLWTFITTQSAAKLIMPVRIIKECIMIPIKLVVMYVLMEILRKNKEIREENDTNTENEL